MRTGQERCSIAHGDFLALSVTNVAGNADQGVDRESTTGAQTKEERMVAMR
jgi:hypothetical protein